MEEDEKRELKEEKPEVKKGPARDPNKEKFWRQRLTEWSGSGMSIREYCKDYGVSEAQFYAWRRELRFRDVIEKDKPAGFIELVGKGMGGRISGISIQVGDGLSIALERGFDEQTLKAVLMTVEEVGL